MRLKLQPKAKKYIAALLTLSMAGGCLLGIGGMETKAQEQTLPGIEKLVSGYVASGETFQILEIVSDKENASFGYLVGGQEPIYEGRKLSQMPSNAERTLRMAELEANLDSLGDKLGSDSLMTYEAYAEGAGSRYEEVRGQFVEGNGSYNYVYHPASYRPLASGEVTDKQRFDRIFYCEEANDINGDNASVTVTFSYIDTGDGGSDYLSMDYITVSSNETGYTNRRYNLYQSDTLADVADRIGDSAPADYIGQDVYINSSDTTYTYFGYVAWGADVLADGGMPSVSAGNASDASLSVYIVNPAANTAYEWASCVGDSYTFKNDYAALAGAEFVSFVENSVNGDYYISKAIDSEYGAWRIAEEYQANDSGSYIIEQEAATSIVYETESGFDTSKVYAFVGDCRLDVVDSFCYEGGLYSNEWFKKHVLNLSGSSAYEKNSNGSDMDAMQVDVKTLTVSELVDMVNNGTYYGVNLEDVDFLYLSGKGDCPNYGEGLEKAALCLAKLVYGEGTDSERIPTIVDYGFYEKNRNVGNEVLAKLALLLLQVDSISMQETVAGADESLWAALDSMALAESVNVQMQDGASLLAAEADGLVCKEYLAESVYLNDDTYAPLVAGDFLTDFTDVTMTDKGHDAQRFSQVLDEIAYENFLQDKANPGTTSLLTEEVNKASIIRYILNRSAHRVTVKSSLRVLDLEPCYDFDEDTALNTEAVKAFMNQENYEGSIRITPMASAEFIGKIEDLNEEYDLIYVGARTGMMNTDDTGKTVYNDADMNGLIYMHTGDVYSYVQNEYKGSSEADEERWRLRDDSIGWYDYYRAPGNDMNSTREEEFEQYIEAGYPVIFADELLRNIDDAVSVNNVTVDCNSYFDELIDFALSKDANGNYKYWQKNVYAASQLSVQSSETESETAKRELRQTTFCKYLNLSKLTVNWVTNRGEEYMPVEYTDEAGGTFLKSKNGEYSLQFIFSLTNDAALSQVSTAYECRLYVDTNSDGRFAGADYVMNQNNENSEELTGLAIYIWKDNGWEPLSPIQTEEDTGYQLYTGYTYKVVRPLPEDFQGVVPWKLVFYDVQDRLVRTAKSGYTAIRREGVTENIQVLQLMSDKKLSNGKERWNLERDSEMTELLEQVPDFEVNIESVYASDFIDGLVKDNRKWTTQQRYNAYYQAAYTELFNYDMIILGFGDNYRFGESGKETANMAVAEALRDYIEAGRSVLFTHDSSSYINTDSEEARSNSWYWGYEFNKTMRAAVGLDRYGSLQLYYEDMRDSYSENSDMWKRYNEYLTILQTEYNYDSVYRPYSAVDATAHKGETLAQVEGLTGFTLVRYMYKQLTEWEGPDDMEYLFPIRNSVFYKAVNWKADTANIVDGQYAYDDQKMPKLMATQVNKGQITTYPFVIEEELPVESTHYQWLQPNMELDKDHDGKNDIVVWYTLSDVSDEAHPDNQETNIYNINPKDVVNNYYIYSMGNVTYSGAGHTRPTTENEKKLFVNTMVAAYSSGVKSPRVVVKNQNNDNADTFYMLYDPVNKMVLSGQENVKIRFQAVDYNVLSGGTQIRIDIYKACNSANEALGIDVAGIGEKVMPVDVDKIEISQVTDGEPADKMVTPVSANEEIFKDYFKNVYYPVDNGMTYEISLSTEELGLFSTDGENMTLLGNAAADTFYIRATTVYENGTERTESGVSQFRVSAAELFDLK